MIGYTALLEKRMWVIYKISNPDNESYIGMTSDYHNRMSSYRNGRCEKQKLLDASFLQHGFDKHTIEILDSFFSDKSYAKGKELFWIRTNMSNRSKYPEQRGLNLTDGYGGLGVYFSPERRQKQRERMTGNIPSDYQRQRASEANKGNKYSVGRKHTPEQTAKIVSQTKGKARTPEQLERYKDMAIRLYGKAVVQTDSKGLILKKFDTIQEACEGLNLSEATIHRIIKNENPQNRKNKTKHIFLQWSKKIEESFEPITFQRRIFKQQEIKTA